MTLNDVVAALQLLAALPFSLSTPFPTELAAFPRGKAFACLANSRIVRNVRIARGAAFIPAVVTKLTAGDGQEIGYPMWSPTARRSSSRATPDPAPTANSNRKVVVANSPDPAGFLRKQGVPFEQNTAGVFLARYLKP